MGSETKNIPSRDVYGIFLIDGNHVFLHCLNEHTQQIKKSLNWINNFSLESERKRRQELLINKSPEIIEKFYKDWDSDTKINDTYEFTLNSYLPKLKKFNADDLVPHFAKYARFYSFEFHKKFLNNLSFSFERIFKNGEHLKRWLKLKKIESMPAIISKLTLESFIFDADLPPKDFLFNKLSNDLIDAERWHLNSKKDYLKEALDNLKNNVWDFPFEKSQIKAPYNSKTKFLDFLENKYAIHQENKTLLIRGKKYINAHNTYLSQHEKEVDARLVIKGCEAAHNKKVDFVCLITNDGDYLPLVQHLQGNNKQVFLLSLVDEKTVSNPLKKQVGVKNIININNIDSKTLSDVDWEYEQFRCYMGDQENLETIYENGYYDELIIEHEEWLKAMEDMEKMGLLDDKKPPKK